jgi:hypothetical protein
MFENIYAVCAILAELFGKPFNLVANENRADFYAEFIAEHSCPSEQFETNIFKFACVLFGKHPYFALGLTEIIETSCN